MAPHERYYSHRHWGPRGVVVKNVNVVNVNIQKHRNVRHAIVINNRNLHATDNYRNIIIRNTNHRTIVNKYKPGLVVDQKLARRDRGKEKFSFKSVDTGRKFHARIAKRIKHDSFVATSRGLVKADAIGGKKKDSKPSNAMGRKLITPFKTRHEVVKVPEASRGYSKGRHQNKDIKANNKPLPASTRVDRADRRSQRTPKEPLTVARKGIVHPKAPVSSRTQMDPVPEGLPEGPPVKPRTQFHRPRRTEQRVLERAKPQTNQLPSQPAHRQRIKVDAPKLKGREIPERAKPQSSSYVNGEGRDGQRRLSKQSNSFSKRDFRSHRRD